LVRSIQARVPLDPDKGETWALNQWDSGRREYVTKRPITAVGYDKLNLFWGVSFFTPERIIDDDGRPTSNPYFHRDEHGEIHFVKIRMIGLGRNAVGTLQAIDLTVTYNLRTYFAQDLYSKWTGKKAEATKAWGVLMPSQYAKGDATHLVVPVAGGASLVVDLANKEVVYALAEHLNRQKFAERNAQTICRRNILKKFSGLQFAPSGAVAVVGWTQPDRDFITIGRKVAEANEGRIIVDDEPIEMEREHQTLDTKEQVDEALAGVQDADDGDTPLDDGPGDDEVPGSVAASPPPTAKPETPQQSEKARDLVTKIRDVCEDLDGDTVTGVVNKLGYDHWSDLAAEIDEGRLGKALVEFKRASQATSQATQTAPAAGQGQLPLKPATRPGQHRR